MINPSWLRTFATLVEQGHFTKTAEILAMTQPGVSQHIKKLEEYYSTALIHRHGKQFEVTPAGEQVYRFAQEWIQNEQDLKEQLKRDDPYSGTCSMASPGALGLRLYPQLLSLQKQHPDLRILYEIAPNHRIESELLNGHLDFGLMTRQPTSSTLIAKPVSQERLCLIAPKAFHSSRYEDLQELGLISHPDAAHHTGLLFQANFPDQFLGVSDFPVKSYINQINLILEPVAAGLGFTVLPASALKAFHNREAIHTIDLPFPVYETVYQVYKRHRTLPARYPMLTTVLLPLE